MVSMFQSGLDAPRDDLQKKCFLGVTNGPFIDGRTTGIEPARGGFTIHCLDPLGYIRPYPRTGCCLYLRSDPFWTPLWPLSKRSFFLYYNYSSKSIYCFLELGEAKLQQVEASRQSFKQRGWAVHFIDLTSLYLRLKIGAGRAVKARLVDSKRAASYGFYEQQAPTYSYKNEKQQAPLEEASPHHRKPLHASLLYRVPNLRTPKLQALKPLLCWDIGRSPFLQTFL